MMTLNRRFMYSMYVRDLHLAKKIWRVRIQIIEVVELLQTGGGKTFVEFDASTWFCRP